MYFILVLDFKNQQNYHGSFSLGCLLLLLLPSMNRNPITYDLKLKYTLANPDSCFFSFDPDPVRSYNIQIQNSRVSAFYIICPKQKTNVIFIHYVLYTS